MTDTTGSTSAKDQAQAAAGTAADEGRHVAGVAGDEVRSVAGEAQTHVKGLLDEALVQVDEQTRTQRDRIASTMQTFADDLQKMASSSDVGGLAADLAHQAADRARTLGQHLDGREPNDLLDDVRRFARDRPGVFLLGALAAGVAAGRLARGAKSASSTGSTGSGTGSTQSAPVAVPVADVFPTADVTTDPFGDDSPPIGTTVPPTAVGRYEP